MDRETRRLVAAIGGDEMKIMVVLEDIPAFVGLDEKVWKLRRGDMVSVNPGLPFRQAKILIDREKARWVGL
ncbi:MAG: hypothetical protein RBR39_07890 [Proteiniphilum sp.]|nr:hypothetical protein [Proteiniphilum sp.]